MRKLVVRPSGPEGCLEKQWKVDKDRRVLENAPFGVKYQVVSVVYEDTGELHHEGVIVLSRRCELHIVIRGDGHIGLVFHRREKVIPPEVAQEFFKENPSGTPDVSHVKGIEQFECPHGLAIKALVEAEEETGYAISEAVHVGFIKESPSMGGIAHVFYATRLSNRPSGKKIEEGEQVMGIRFFPPEEIRNVQTICGLTQAALWRFRCWGLKQASGSFWNDVAVRL